MREAHIVVDKIPMAARPVAPGATAGMSVGPDMASPKPAAIATGGIGTDLVGGVDVAAAATF
jgi:hypothetical protein